MNKKSTLISALAVLAFLLIGLTGTDLTHSRTGVGLLVLGGVGLLWSLASLSGKSKLGNGWLVLLALAGGGYFVARAFLVGPPALAVADGVLVLGGFMMYLLVASTPREARRFWMVGLIILASLNAFMAISQKLSGTPFYLWYGSLGKGTMVSGLFGHYNAFASFLNGTLFFFLSFVVLGKGKGWRVLGAVLVVAMVVAVALSGSRGGWLSLMAGGAVWMVLLWIYLSRRESRMTGVVAVLGMLAVVGGVVGAIPAVKSLTAARLEAMNANPEMVEEVDLGQMDGGRFVFQQMAFEVFQDAPVTGQGPRAFSYRSLEKWDPEAFGMWNALPVFAHNEYLQVLADYGLIGFLIVVVLLFLHGVVGLAGISGLSGTDSRDPELSIWQLGALAGLAAILCQSFFSFLFHFPSCVALVAFQLGMLVSRPTPQSPQAARGGPITGRLAGLGGLGLVAGLLMLGWPLTQAYQLHRQAEIDLATAGRPGEVMRALQLKVEAANKNRNPDLLEEVARRAMSEANEADQAGYPEIARDFRLQARAALQRALELNPHFGEAIAGLPRIEDALGNYDEAEKGHQRAMEELWTREISFRPHYQAARSSYYRAFRAESDEGTLALLRQSWERLMRRREVLRRNYWFVPEVNEFAKEVEAWLAFYEGRLLFKKGDDIWKKARPRNPELAYALFLEARKRYQKSEELISGREPRWKPDFAQLEFQIEILKNGRVEPVSLSDEEIREAIDSDPGLASGESSR